MPYKITHGSGNEKLLQQGQFVKLNVEYKLKSKDTTLSSTFGVIPVYFPIDTASLGKYGYPKTQKEAHEISRAINESMGRMPRDVTKDLNIGLGENTPSITQKVGKNKEINVKGLGPGALLAFTDLVKAEGERQKTGNYGPLAETAFNLASALVHPVAGPLATYTGGLNTNEARELAIRRKMGGGRGVSPPGMGQR
jgi:hypothetical protein